MRIVGIVAEYNPLHRGHIYQIQQACQTASADAVVVVMSGNYVQRGEPAIIDKYARTRMALSAGADVVLELPVSWATGSGERFADGAVSIFHRLNCVDALAYGCETPDSPLWNTLPSMLAFETPEYKELLRSQLNRGKTFPVARAQVLEQLLPGSAKLLNSPNNILAMEYRKALLRRDNHTIVPLAIQRIGSGYHDTQIQGSEHFASASAIRQVLAEQMPPLTGDSSHKPAPSGPADTFPQVLREQMSDEALAQLTYQIQPDDLSPFLDYALLYSNPADWPKIQDMDEDLTNRLLKILRDSQVRTFTQLAEELKSRHITRTHVNRALLHLLLNLRDEEHEPSAVRLLGFRRNSGIMRVLQDAAEIPIVTRMGDAPEGVFDADIRASHLYNRIVYRRFGRIIPDEYRHRILIQD